MLAADQAASCAVLCCRREKQEQKAEEERLRKQKADKEAADKAAAEKAAAEKAAAGWTCFCSLYFLIIPAGLHTVHCNN